MKFSGILTALLSSGIVLAQDSFKVALVSRDPKDLRQIINKHDFDYGCHPTISSKDGEHTLHAFLSGFEIDELKRSLDSNVVRIDTLHSLRARQVNTGAAVGKGDRFSNGTVFPRGLGTQSTSSQVNGGILNVQEIDSALRALAKEYGIQTFTAPFKTYEGRSVYGAVANTRAADLQTIYFTSGIHARERGGPDNLIYFVADLLYANKNNVGVKWGSKSYTNAQVKVALSQGIVFIPMLNPDGVQYDQTNNNKWRKNRNPKSSTTGVASSVGVDLNRNFDFLWDYPKYFDRSVSPASTSPRSETYKGTAPFSEPETQNVRWGYEQFKNLSYYIDVHSAVGDLLYSWGDDNNQFTDPSQNFRNSAYDGKRGVVDDSVYREYITQLDSDNAVTIANRTVAAMKAVGGRSYDAIPAVGLYPTSGASDDWSFSRWQSDKSLNKVYGYTLEFAPSGNFYPTTSEYSQNILDTAAGFMEFILAASETKRFG